MRKTLAFFCVLSVRLFAQNTCDAPAALINPKGSTIFSPEQEGYLGDISAERLQQQLRVYRQPALLTPIERIAARLEQHLPRNQYSFQFSLLEIPEANAFALPGGRIYISRRLIAFAQSEDELAGVIAHEMGHIVARQTSMQMTRTFKQVLGVTSVGDRDDIFRKFNQLLDNANRKPG
ncbi:MAG TPA: M48 family metalloprotease, partial [Bryobacteraceae bacterium]|nr:M48 family metalloprotease [Bryobacteraceae bacterium]